MSCSTPMLHDAGACGCKPQARPRNRRALKREVLTRSFGRFVAWCWPLITGAPFTPNAIADEIIGTLQRVADGELSRVLICCPPGCGKSTLLAAYSAWRLARDAGHRSIHGGHSSALAENESRRVRRLVEGDEYRAMFPSVKLRGDENTAAHWSTDHDGRYFAVGTDGALTGKRAHEAIVDDPLNATDRRSRSARESVWTWFQESLSSRLDGDRAPMIVCMQRLDRDDLAGRLIEVGGWHLVEIAAEDEHGNPTAPNVLPRAKLDEKKAASASTYACQYMQRPSDDANAMIKRTWWRFHRPVNVAEKHPRPSGCDTDVPAIETPTQYDRVVIAVDMTFGGVKTSNDFADAAVWASKGSARFLLERWHKKATQLEQRDAIKALARRYPYAKVLIEKAAGGAGAIEQLTADGIPNIVPVMTGGRGKDERLGMVSPVIEAGNCYLPLGATWLGDFVEELAGASKHDDSRDTTAYALAELAGVADPTLDARVTAYRSAAVNLLEPGEGRAELDAKVDAFRRKLCGDPASSSPNVFERPGIGDAGEPDYAEMARWNVVPGNWRTR